jgi:Leucine-rich repeat (LRR) protein
MQVYNLLRKNLIELPKNLPEKVGDLDCSFNQLTTLNNCPKYINYHFWCHHNKLKTLKSGPERVDMRFHCAHNLLTTLNGSPKIVNGYFYCNNNKLITLEGGPEEVYNFNCSHNQLTTLEDGPQIVGGNFCCNNNPNLSLKEILKFMSKCKIIGRVITDYGDLTKYKNRVLSDREILKIALRIEI